MCPHDTLAPAAKMARLGRPGRDERAFLPGTLPEPTPRPRNSKTANPGAVYRMRASPPPRRRGALVLLVPDSGGSAMPSGKQRKRKPPPPPPSKIAGWVGVAIVALVLPGTLATLALKLHVF